jgi:hypothetical protein
MSTGDPVCPIHGIRTCRCWETRCNTFTVPLVFTGTAFVAAPVIIERLTATEDLEQKYGEVIDKHFWEMT